MNSSGTLGEAEAHPAAYSAREWLSKLPLEKLCMWRESFASCALSGNRQAEVCLETLNRLMSSEPVSDRYLLGLAWTIRQGEELGGQPVD